MHRSAWILVLARMALASVPGDISPSPLTTVDEFRRSCAAAPAPTGSVRLRGSVTLAPGTIPDEPLVFYLQDDTGGISVHPSTPAVLTLANQVEVTGKCSLFDNLELEVAADSVRLLERRVPIQPTVVSPAAAAAGRPEGQLVRLRGTVLSASIGETRDRLQVGDSKASVGVYIRRPLNHPSVLVQMAPPDSIVEVDGILILTGRGLYQVRMRSNRDLRLIRSPRPWFVKNLPALLAALGILVGLAGLWIVSMQRTLRKKTSQIRQLLEEARAASELKSQFLANVSHEIRTPIHGILGLQSLLLETPLREDQREQLLIANEATRSLRTLLDDLLDLSRIEAGRMTLTPVPVSLRALVAQSLLPFASQAGEKGVAVTQEIHPELPQTVYADDTRLRQILTNLVSNGVKFTSRGEVAVSVQPTHHSPGRCTVRFSVRDTGIGIAVDKLANVFESFQQADGSITRRFGGTGLGLSIASRLASMMGGRIEVQSKLNEGSVFSLELEFPVIEEAPVPLPDVAADETWPIALRILLAEDNPVNQVVATRLLQKDAHQVSLACTGREAVECYREGEFDVVLMDVQMPELDGLEATRMIRSLELELGRAVPIIALSAHTMKQEAERCLAAGMNEFVGKPFHQVELRQALRRAMSAHSVSTPADRMP